MFYLNYDWTDKAFSIIAIIFVILYTIKMLGWLCGSERIKHRIDKLYDSRVKRLVYLIIFILGSLLLLTKLKITEYAVAVLTIGALYDYFFSLFPRKSGELVKESMTQKRRMWFFGIMFPFILMISVICYVVFG